MASPGVGPCHSYATDFVWILARDGAIEVVKRPVVVDERRLVGEGLINGAGWADINENFGHLREVVGIFAKGKEFARAARPSGGESEVEHSVLIAVGHDVGVGREARIGAVMRTVGEDRIAGIACPVRKVT